MKKSGFEFSLPDTPPDTVEDLISNEIPQDFVVSSKPFSRGRKQTHLRDAQIYPQHEFFQNLSAMDTKHQTQFYQHWKKSQCLPVLSAGLTLWVTFAVTHSILQWNASLDSSSKSSLSLEAPDVEGTTHPSPFQIIGALKQTKIF